VRSLLSIGAVVVISALTVGGAFVFPRETEAQEQPSLQAFVANYQGLAVRTRTNLASPSESFYDTGFRSVVSRQNLNKYVLFAPDAIPQLGQPQAQTAPTGDGNPASSSSAFIVLSKSDDANRYFVVFAARGSTVETRSWTGHAFVVWGIEDTRTQQSSYRAYGMYPKDPNEDGDKNAGFGAVPQEILRMVFGGPGELRDEAPKMHSVGAITHDLIVEVNKGQYDQSFGLAMMTLARPSDFKLLKSDCVTFMSGIALNLLGQDVPARDLANSLPQTFVVDLIRSVSIPKTITTPGMTYTGQTWMGRIPNGEGTATFSTGHTFTGRWVMGLPRAGIQKFPNGNTFDGTFNGGLPDQGTFTWTGTGERLEAQFKQGTAVHGTYYWKNGTTLTGDIRDDKFTGSVTMKLPDGSRYEGNWSKGRPQGHGILTLADTSRYDGEWDNGKPQGHGILTLPDGSRYDGAWIAGKADGSGTITTADGSRATGTWRNGAFDAEHARYRDVDGREHGFEIREGRGFRGGDEMGGRESVESHEERTMDSHPIRGIELAPERRLP
jgi:hypothetical protein